MALGSGTKKRGGKTTKKTKSTKKKPKKPGAGGGILESVSGGSRPTRHVVKMKGRTFAKLSVLPPDLGSTVRGDVQGITSPSGYSSFFMKTRTGPAMAVSHLRSNTRDRPPNEETVDELAGDVGQIYGAEQGGELPTTLVMQVNRVDEAAGREAVRALIDEINSDATDGRRLGLVEEPQENSTSDPVSLVFKVAPLPAAAQGDPASRRDGDGPPPRDAAGRDRDGGAVAPPRRPAVTPPADPREALRNDVPLAPIMTMDEFNRATRVRGRGERTPGYQRLTDSLAAYHQGLAEYRSEANTIKTKLAAIGAQKSALAGQLSTLQSSLKEAEGKSVQGGLDLTRLLGEASSLRAELDSTPDETTRAEIESRIAEKYRQSEDVIRKLEDGNGTLTGRREIARMEREIPEIIARIRKLDEALNALSRENDQLLLDHEKQISDRGADVLGRANAYLATKTASSRDNKQAAVRDLMRQVADPDQHLQRLKEEASKVWNVDYRHQLESPAAVLNTGTASDVFRVETNGVIGDSGRRVGFAKRALTTDDVGNDTTANLGLGSPGKPLSRPPNLIARQVVTSRIDKALDLNVIADEVFSADADGRTIGITAMAPGRQARKNIAIPTQVREGNKTDDTIFEHAHFDLSNPLVQKGLSDLQLMDAITGQMDRHLGNFFIDEATGKVTGIDNDMAFAVDTAFLQANGLPSFVKDRVTKELTYVQDQIDRGTAEKVLALGEDELASLIRGKPDDPERMGDAEVGHAITRLRAIKARIQELKDARPSGLIDDWGAGTFNRASSEGVADNGQELNYVARIQQAYHHAGRGEDPFARQEVQGQ